MSVRSALLLVALAGLGGCEDPSVEPIAPVAKPEPAAKPELGSPPTPEPAPVAEPEPVPEPQPAPEPEPVPKPKPAKKPSPGPTQSIHYIDCVRSCTKTNPIAELSEAEARLDCEASCDPN